MGNLHDGHLSLIKYAQNKKQFVVVSIFVNPLQFDNSEDFKKYPKTIKKDLRDLKKKLMLISFFYLKMISLKGIFQKLFLNQ